MMRWTAGDLYLSPKLVIGICLCNMAVEIHPLNFKPILFRRSFALNQLAAIPNPHHYRQFWGFQLKISSSLSRLHQTTQPAKMCKIQGVSICQDSRVNDRTVIKLFEKFFSLAHNSEGRFYGTLFFPTLQPSAEREDSWALIDVVTFHWESGQRSFSEEIKAEQVKYTKNWHLIL